MNANEMLIRRASEIDVGTVFVRRGVVYRVDYVLDMIFEDLGCFVKIVATNLATEKQAALDLVPAGELLSVARAA